jgi:hypothetical protein
MSRKRLKNIKENVINELFVNFRNRLRDAMLFLTSEEKILTFTYYGIKSGRRFDVLSKAFFKRHCSISL